MGFFDKVKSFGLAIKCGVGLHGGEYKNEEGKPECFFSKTCPDCGKYLTKNEHKFNDWIFPKHGSCHAYRECIYCGQEENAILHSFQEYVDSNCRVTAKCGRCGFEENKGFSHDYETYGKDENCRIIEICSRCKDRRLGSVKHDWLKIPFTETNLKIDGKRKCKDCGYVEN